MARFIYTFSLIVTCFPLTPGRWKDLEELFGERGACAGCWCMVWRRTRKDFESGKGAGNRRALMTRAKKSPPPGVLGYLDGRAVAWCSVGPREEFSYLARARTLKPSDDQPVWSVTCFFIHKNYRRRGLSAEILKAAVELVRSQGGKIVEGYPMASRAENIPDVFAWTGHAAAFERAGFQEVPSESKSRRVMRVEVSAPKRKRPPRG